MELIHFQHMHISAQREYGEAYTLKRNTTFRVFFTKKGVFWSSAEIVLTRSETEELHYIIDNEIENVEEG